MMPTIREYCSALNVIEAYEAEQRKKYKHTTKCSECGMLFGYGDKELQETRIVNNAGTEIYIGKCPYCDKETVYMRY